MTMEIGLDNLKERYEEVAKEYNLPSFKEMNEDFEIEKLHDKETDLLVREIRRAMIEKNAAYLRFVEMFLNPSNAPMFFLALVKNMDNSAKKVLDELYLKLGKFEIKSISLDNFYDEKKEAEFVCEFFYGWQEIKGFFQKITDELEDSWKKKSDKKEKGYLG